MGVSALSVGFISATISYDYDTDPEKRKLSPEFYGFVPAKASDRTIVFSSMVVFSSGMLLIRCMTIIILALLGSRWVALYIGADLGLYLTVKIMRGDFWYWVPVGGSVEILSSMLGRILVKLIGDFTSIVQFRHPYELGGFYWAFGLVLTLASLPSAIVFYRNEDGDVNVVEFAWTLLHVLVPSTVAFLFLFFYKVSRSHLTTFLSLKKGKDLTRSQFRR